MNKLFSILLTLSIIASLGCDGSEEQVGGWGLEEPVITSGEGFYQLTDFENLSGEYTSVNDQIIFNDKYEKQNINLEITAVCDGSVQKFKTKLKSKTNIWELIPHQLYLNIKKNKDISCNFMFKAKNKSGDIHLFNSGFLKIKSNEIIKNIGSFQINKKYNLNDKAIKVKPKGTVYKDQLLLYGNGADGLYSLACEAFTKKLGGFTDFNINLGKLKLNSPINKCILTLVSSSKLKKTVEFILKKNIAKPKINFIKPTENPLIDYQVEIEGGLIKIKNTSNKNLTVSLSKKSLAIKLLAQFKFIKKYSYFSRAHRPQLSINLSPQIFINNSRRKEKDGFYHFKIKPKSTLKVTLKYSLPSHDKLKINKKLNCPIAGTKNIIGYKLIYPSGVEFFQFKNKHLPSDTLLDNLNLIQKEIVPLYSNPLAYKYVNNAIGCGIKDIQRLYSKLIPKGGF